MKSPDPAHLLLVKEMVSVLRDAGWTHEAILAAINEHKNIAVNSETRLALQSATDRLERMRRKAK